MAKIVTLLAVLLLFFVAGTTGRKVASANSCEAKDLSGEIDFEARTAVFEGGEISIPKIAFEDGGIKVLGAEAGNVEKWIEVDLSEQKLKAWEGDKLFLETLVSTGLPYFPTPTGEFRIWYKIRSTRMEGGTGKYYYNLPNVPYVMFFENDKVPGHKGYGLHGTYWHSDFGTRRSHGCVNLPTQVAGQLYLWTNPAVPEGKNLTRAESADQGTRIVIHD